MSRLLGLALVALLVAAPEAPTGAPAIPTDRASVLHALNRLTFGPRPGDVERVRTEGLAGWIDRQLEPGRIDNRALDSRLSSFDTLALDTGTIVREYHQPAIAERRHRQREAQPAGDPAMAPDAAAGGTPRQRAPLMSEAQQRDRQVIFELEEAKILRAVYSERQLEEVLVDFWFNHFNVFAGKGPVRAFVTAFERDAIRPHVLGDFRQMLEAVATSPAMLFYLDNWMNSDPEAADRMGRRLAPMRPGVVPLPGGNPAGLPQGPSAGGAPQAVPPGAPRPAQAMRRGLNENYARELLELHTLGVDGGYTQDDVVSVARAFTGWTFRPRDGSGFVFVPALHDAKEKLVLGQKLPAGGGIEDGRRVLDILVAHPSTARYIAFKLAQKLVSDTPPPALVDRVARRFGDTRGSLREVTRAIVISPEFFAAEARQAKVKTPLEFVASALRATGAEVGSARPLARTLRDLGMPLYFCQPPTGYDETADTWVSSGALVARMNFALELGGSRLRGVSLALGTEPSSDALRRRVIEQVLAGQASATTRATLAKATTPEQIVALAIGAPEFQRQ
jgi:uncharacterized protein (DUF1800 family)